MTTSNFLGNANPWMVVSFTNIGNNGRGLVLRSYFVKTDLKVLLRLSGLVNFDKLFFQLGLFLFKMRYLH